MSSYRCRLMEAHDKRDLIEISQLIDLTDKPIGLTRNEIGWSRVRANASNCICCCYNNSITLVTTDESYILDHVPLDNIQHAQANASLQFLALSNHRKIAIIDLVDNDIRCGCYNNNNNNSLPSETKLVNLAAFGLTMNDIIFWRWLDDSTLAILSYEALYTCSVTQHHINHPAYTAFSNRSRYLSMEKVYECHPNLTALCQITDIQRDSSGNLYAISSLYSANTVLRCNHASHTNTNNNSCNQSGSPHHYATLKPSFGSMPSRLSQLGSLDHQSIDSLKSEHLFDPRKSPTTSGHSAVSNGDDTILGLVEVYCKVRDRSQLIQIQAMTFTNSDAPPTLPKPKQGQRRHSAPPEDGFKAQRLDNKGPTLMVAANRTGDRLVVHFIEMSAHSNLTTSGKNSSPSVQFNHLVGKDLPTSVVCSHVNNPRSNDSQLHLAMITTKHGQLFICSVTHSTILFSTRITSDIITNSILESNTQGLMVICRNGQVLLVTLKMEKLMKILDESRTLRHISSSHNLLNPISNIERSSECPEHVTADDAKSTVGSEKSSVTSFSTNRLSSSLDIGLDILITTKL